MYNQYLKVGLLSRRVVHQHRATADHPGSRRTSLKAGSRCGNQKVRSNGGTQLKTALKPPPSVSGYKEHKAWYDYLQESDASCPPTLEPKVYPTKNQSKHRAPLQILWSEEMWEHNTSDPLSFISLFIKIPQMGKKKKKRGGRNCNAMHKAMAGSLHSYCRVSSRITRRRSSKSLNSNPVIE